ncbi:MAG: aromatic ring-hydroxylating dioxygenase subunit alpha, partial [Dehalococcoidia bacterium]|nr:aromatic ring-hydroxylating dioxygenase subunit alpha [Dehalococcoidia bacterium]
YYLEHYDELEKRLGSTRAANPTMTVGTVFPNMSPHGRTQLRLYHPRGPEKTEMWVFCLVDKDAPQEIKDVMRPHLSMTFGPSGTLEQDDMNNWIQCTTSAKGFMGPRYLMNESLGIGHEGKHEKYPAASTAPTPSEHNQRAFYNWWAEIMAAPSWSQIKLDPIEKK